MTLTNPYSCTEAEPVLEAEVVDGKFGDWEFAGFEPGYEQWMCDGRTLDQATESDYYEMCGRLRHLMATRHNVQSLYDSRIGAWWCPPCIHEFPEHLENFMLGHEARSRELDALVAAWKAVEQ